MASSITRFPAITTAPLALSRRSNIAAKLITTRAISAADSLLPPSRTALAVFDLRFSAARKAHYWNLRSTRHSSQSVSAMAPSKPLPLYLKPGCPFCCKTVVFLAERGWLDQVEFRGDSEEERKMIQDKLGKVSFPCLEREDGTLMLESEDVGIYIAKLNGVDVTELHGKAVDYYLTVKDGYIAAYQERIALKKELEELKAK